MRRAIDLAQNLHPHPNPRVGALVVDQAGKVIGKGAHERPGQAHAEVIAIEAAGPRSLGATMFVTLEPCTHHARTPPCVESIISAGISRVVVGSTDPDPRVSGSGLARLRDAGIEVVEDVMPEEVRKLDPAYFHHRETGMPRVTVKYAMTLDGSVAAADATSKWISSDAAREDAHRLRASADAVLVGAGTLRADDPQLSVRLAGEESSHQPIPVIVAGQEDLPATARIWTRSPVVVSTFERHLPSGELLVVSGDEGSPSPVAAARALADIGHLDLLLEGGPRLASAWWDAGVVNRGAIYLAAKIGGGTGIGAFAGAFETMADADVVSITSVRSLGPDYRIDFEI